tara:strand:- start:343 stop:531 length:189 start_codon:yes stop_codon:yes gene_type:complete
MEHLKRLCNWGCEPWLVRRMAHTTLDRLWRKANIASKSPVFDGLLKVTLDEIDDIERLLKVI